MRIHIEPIALRERLKAGVLPDATTSKSGPSSSKLDPWDETRYKNKDRTRYFTGIVCLNDTSVEWTDSAAEEEDDDDWFPEGSYAKLEERDLPNEYGGHIMSTAGTVLNDPILHFGPAVPPTGETLVGGLDSLKDATNEQANDSMHINAAAAPSTPVRPTTSPSVPNLARSFAALNAEEGVLGVPDRGRILVASSTDVSPVRFLGADHYSDLRDQEDDFALLRDPGLEHAVNSSIERALTQAEAALWQASQASQEAIQELTPAPTVDSHLAPSPRKREGATLLSPRKSRRKPAADLQDSISSSITASGSRTQPKPSGRRPRATAASTSAPAVEKKQTARTSSVKFPPTYQIGFRTSAQRLKDLKPDETQSFVGAILQINPVQTWTRADGEEVAFRTLCVGDSSQQFFSITLWAHRTTWLADDGQPDRFQIGDIVLFDQMKIRSFTKRRKQEFSATTTYGTKAALLYRFDTTSECYVSAMTPTRELAVVALDVVCFASSDPFLVAQRLAVKRSLELMQKPLARRAEVSIGRVVDLVEGVSNELHGILLGVLQPPLAQESPAKTAQSSQDDVLIDFVDSAGQKATLLCSRKNDTLVAEAKKYIDGRVVFNGVEVVAGPNGSHTLRLTSKAKIRAEQNTALEFHARFTVGLVAYARPFESLRDLQGSAYNGLALITAEVSGLYFQILPDILLSAKEFAVATNRLRHNLDNIPAVFCKTCGGKGQADKNSVLRCSNRCLVSAQQVSWTFNTMTVVLTEEYLPKRQLHSRQFLDVPSPLKTGAVASAQSTNSDLNASLFRDLQGPGSVVQTNVAAALPSPSLQFQRAEIVDLGISVPTGEAGLSLFPGIRPGDFKIEGKAAAAFILLQKQIANLLGVGQPKPPRKTFLVSVSKTFDEAGFEKSSRFVLKQYLD